MSNNTLGPLSSPLTTILDDLTTWMQTTVGVSTTASVFITFLALFVYPILFPPRKDAIRELGGLSILTAWPFFSKRYDFLVSNFKKTGEKLFQFRVLQHSIVAVRGEEARKTFFDNRSLDFTEGYKILMGAAPRLNDIAIDTSTQDNVSWFTKTLLTIFHKDRLTDVIPTLFEDVNKRMVAWGKQGQIDPFKNVYDLVFQMTVRMATCRELSEDQEALARFQHHYWILEKSATPTALLFPWFPGTAKRNKETATKELYMMIYGYVEARRASAVPTSDAIDLMISKGMDNDSIIGFVLGVVFAGVINTGINSCWILMYLAANPEWKQKVTAEVMSLIEKHTNTTSTDPLHKRLSSIPITAWEDEMPAIDLVIRETIRLVLTGATLRRNVSDDLQISDKIVKKGAFMVYSLSDVHLNPDIYSEPERFDPSRFEPGRQEDKKGTFAYMGWGAGRHPCAGMKVAKLEMKMIVALFLTGFEYDLVDKSGNFPDPFPTADRNDIQQARPLGDPCYLRYKRVVE